MSTYARLPVSFTRGEGVWVWDTENKKYLDAFSGVAVCSLGHAHPAVAEAVCRQARQLIHTSNHYGIELQTQLAERLTQLSGMQNVFFCNSGAEANEAAIKIARLYGHKHGVELPTLVVMENSFHGRTLATLTATGNRRAQAGFEPLMPGFVRVAFGDVDAIATIARNTPNIVAVLVEPIQGEGGVHIPDDGYLARIREICDENQWLMMLDEVQTGMGRTGRLFAFEHAGIRPDVMTLAKALGNGVPIGACLAQGEAATMFSSGTHGSTFGGNPLACSAALAVLETLEREGLVERAKALGTRIIEGLRTRLEAVAGVEEVRGKGLMMGVELNRPCGALTKEALARGLLINVTAERVIRLLPPLILSDAEADQMVESLSGLICDFLKH